MFALNSPVFTFCMRSDALSRVRQSHTFTNVTILKVLKHGFRLRPGAPESTTHGFIFKDSSYICQAKLANDRHFPATNPLSWVMLSFVFLEVMPVAQEYLPKRNIFRRDNVSCLQCINCYHQLNGIVNSKINMAAKKKE